MSVSYDDVIDGNVYRDERTGWIGAACKPESLEKCPTSPKDGHRKIPLRGASGKEDRADEIRYAFFDDLTPVDSGPVGFGGNDG